MFQADVGANNCDAANAPPQKASVTITALAPLRRRTDAEYQPKFAVAGDSFDPRAGKTGQWVQILAEFGAAIGFGGLGKIGFGGLGRTGTLTSTGKARLRSSASGEI